MPHSKFRGTDLIRDLLIAVAAVAIVTLARLFFAPVLHDRAAFILYGLAIMGCAWAGGRRLGLIATALAVPAGTWLFVKPFPAMSPMQVDAQVLLYAIEGVGISLIAGRLHESRNQAVRSLAEWRDLAQSLDSGFQAFDADYRVTFTNRAAEEILGKSAAEVAGTYFWDQFPRMNPESESTLRVLMAQRASGGCETFYEPWSRWLAIQVYPFRDGSSVLFADISERKNAQAERERLILELQDALANIRTLSGLIPICAWCKRIRNDSGYWEQLEQYLGEHSEAEFTHGMCPDCVIRYSEKKSA
jgi:PAS domain S-box-containing protein